MEYGDLHSMRSNSETIKRLSGENGRKLIFFIPPDKFMKDGEYLDGWGKPLLIRIINHSVEIRSAGKDSIFFTKDDLVEKKTEPNQAMQRTSASVTDRAPSSTLRASHSRL